MPPSLDQLRELPVSEKLKIVEQLWDDISEADVPLILQEWQKTEAKRRRDELQADPTTALTREELWKRVDGVDE